MVQTLHENACFTCARVLNGPFLSATGVAHHLRLWQWVLCSSWVYRILPQPHLPETPQLHQRYLPLHPNPKQDTGFHTSVFISNWYRFIIHQHRHRFWPAGCPLCTSPVPRPRQARQSPVGTTHHQPAQELLCLQQQALPPDPRDSNGQEVCAQLCEHLHGWIWIVCFAVLPIAAPGVLSVPGRHLRGLAT